MLKVIKSYSMEAVPAPEEESSASTKPRGSTPDVFGDPNKLAHDAVDEQEERLRQMAEALLASARQDAIRIRAEAREQAAADAQRLLEDARIEAKEIHQKAAEQGCAEGMHAALTDMQKQMDQWQQAVEEILQQQNQRFARLNEQVLELALEVAEKILSAKVGWEPNVMLPVVQAVVNNLDQKNAITVCLTKTMPELIDYVQQAMQQRGNVTVRAMDLPAGGCRVETMGEIIDASVMTQLENLKLLLAQVTTLSPQEE